MNVVRQIQAFNAGRDPERLALKYRAMRGDPFVFLRASCHLFYARLPAEPVLRKAPAAWACGDLHLENFGSYKGDNRQVYFDINDFDEAVLAPASWDPVRFLASLLVGRASLGLAGAARRDVPLQLCALFLDAYGQALADGKPRWVERETAPPPVGTLLQAVRTRTREAFLDTRTERSGRHRRIRTGNGKALPDFGDEAQRVVAVQRRMQAIAMAFLHPVVMDSGPYVLRALQPSEDRVALAGTRKPVARLQNLVRVMAQCLAWAQLRGSGRGGAATADELGDFAQGGQWRTRLLDIARHGASQVEADWKIFSAAYDEGAFGGRDQGLSRP